MGLGGGWRGRIADALRVGADHRTFSRRRLGLFATLRLDLFFGALLLIGALEVDPLLEGLLDQVRAAALGAFLGHGLVVRSEVTFRVIRTAPKDVAPPRLAFGHVADAALGALHAFNQILLDVSALGIAGAGDELAVGSVAQHERLAADRAVFASRLRRLLLLLG